MDPPVIRIAHLTGVIYKYVALSVLKISIQNHILDESRCIGLSIALNFSCKEYLSMEIWLFGDRDSATDPDHGTLILVRYLK